MRLSILLSLKKVNGSDFSEKEIKGEIEQLR